jgi:hypothetical protein
MQKYNEQSPELLPEAFQLPTPNDIALYLRTSSTSSVANVKCVGDTQILTIRNLPNFATLSRTTAERAPLPIRLADILLFSTATYKIH